MIAIRPGFSNVQHTYKYTILFAVLVYELGGWITSHKNTTTKRRDAYGLAMLRNEWKRALCRWQKAKGD